MEIRLESRAPFFAKKIGQAALISGSATRGGEEYQNFRSLKVRWRRKVYAVVVLQRLYEAHAAALPNYLPVFRESTL